MKHAIITAVGVCILLLSLACEKGPLLEDESDKTDFLWNPDPILESEFTILKLGSDVRGNVYASPSWPHNRILRSAGGGLKWDSLDIPVLPSTTPIPGFPPTSSLAEKIIGSEDGGLYVALSSGLYVSKDAGDSWTRLLEERYGQCSCDGGLRDIALADESTIFVFSFSEENAWGGFTVFYHSEDKGSTWNSIGEINLPYQASSPLAAGGDGSIYMVGRTPEHTAHLIVSYDDGENWQPVALPSGVGPTALAATGNGSIFVASATTGGQAGLYHSFDRGQTWREESASWESRLVSYIAQGENGRICAAGSEVYCSRDGGETWFAYSPEFPIEYIRSLTIDSEGYVYVAVGKGVFKSTKPL